MENENSNLKRKYDELQEDVDRHVESIAEEERQLLKVAEHIKK